MKSTLTLALAGLLLFLGTAAVIAESTRKTPGAAAVQGELQPVRRAVFHVKNLTCGACFSRINQALISLEGFSGMGANLIRKLVAVDFNMPLTPEEIGKTITGLGYPATLDRLDLLGKKESFAYLGSRRSRPGGGGCCGGFAPSPAGCAGPGADRI